MTPSLWVTIIIACAIPLLTWVFSRISKARQGETHQAIHTAVSESQQELSTHIDQRMSQMERRFEQLRHTVEQVDEREMETRTQVAVLKGRMDQMNAQRPQDDA